MRRSTSGWWVLTLSAATGLWGCGEDVIAGAIPPTSAPGIGMAPCGVAPASAPSPSFMEPGRREPIQGPAIQSEAPPPPVSGGTLALSTDGSTLIAADPDRDQIYLVDVASRSLSRVLPLQAADEPGRVVQDKAGRVHVALRGGKGIASFELRDEAQPRRRAICDLPRGLAYDAGRDKLYVACGEGSLVQVDPATGRPERRIQLDRDLRDVVSSEGELIVTRFRSSEVIRIDPDSGEVRDVRKPASSLHHDESTVAIDPITCGLTSTPKLVKSSPDVAWRTIALPGGRVAMVHQRASEGKVQITAGGYGGNNGKCGPGIVRGAITVMDGTGQRSIDLEGLGLFVDLAYEPSTGVIAVANPGGWSAQAGVMTFASPVRSDNAELGQQPEQADCQVSAGRFNTPGQVTAVAFVAPTVLAALQREPAGVTFLDTTNPASQAHVDFQQPSRYDTGHALFHHVTNAGLACASCHAEAGDDGHVWTFQEIGSRRTQGLRGGILGTEPFHWNGDMHDFSMLVTEVFVGRMGGPEPRADHAAVLARWIDKQPILRITPADLGAVERGQALFESEAVGCASCHVGPHFTNNKSADVGTGAFLQVPSLQGLAFRAPFMHDGCAPQLRDRFGSCGGGDHHGRTSHLSQGQLDDLTAYLETL